MCACVCECVCDCVCACERVCVISQLVILNFQEANRVKTLEDKKVREELEAERAITARYRLKANAWEVEKKHLIEAGKEETVKWRAAKQQWDQERKALLAQVGGSCAPALKNVEVS